MPLSVRSVLALAVCSLLFGVLASQAPAQSVDRTVVAYGQASIVPKPKNPRSDASIAAAVKAAATKAVPQALADAKEHATELATAAGVTLGEMLSIANVPLANGPFYGPVYGEDGTFGRGKYCARIRTARRVNGKTVRRTRRICRVPTVVRQVELTYAIA